MNLHSCSFAHQLLLNCENATPCKLTVGLLPSDNDHLRVAILSRKVNFCVGFLPNLNKNLNQSKKNNVSGHMFTDIVSIPCDISTFLMFDPPFPIMFLWNCLKIGTETEWLFST